MELYTSDSSPKLINAIDIGIGKDGTVYILDPYGVAQKLAYNAKEQIYLRNATQTS